MTGRPDRGRLPSRRLLVASAVSLVLVMAGSVAGLQSGAQATAPAEVTITSNDNTVLGAWTSMGAPKGNLDDSFQGPGLNQAVYALAEYQGDIYAGGLFDDTGGGGNNEADCSDDAAYPLQCIAKWTPGPATNPWLPVGAGLNNQVDSFLVKDDILYVGGEFDDVMGGPGLGSCSPQPGLRWTAQPSAPIHDWQSVTWGDDTFVAVASGGQVMTSPNGAAWTERTPAASRNWQSVTWGGPTGQEKFVAVAAGGGSVGQVMTSPDGVTWTSRTSAADRNWESVIWGGNSFVAVASAGSGSRVMTSPDGITWTAGSALGNNNAWQSVTWGGLTGQEKFVAVASSGDDTLIMHSM